MAPSKNTAREAREARDRLRRYNARQAVHAHQITRRRRDNILAIVGILVVASLAAVTQVFYFQAGPGSPTATPTASSDLNVGDVPSTDVAEARTWTGTLALNDVDLAISLDGAAAPQAVASFITDSQNGYFLGKTCHRLVTSGTAGLIQCGSLDGVGGADPDYSYGPIENPGINGVYPAGTIAVARAADDAYSQGHQFFITYQDSTLPDDSAGGYTIIGQVTDGLANFISDIAAGGISTDSDSTSDGPPAITTTITGLTIQ